MHADLYDERVVGPNPPKSTGANHLVLTVPRSMPVAATFGTVRAWADRHPLSVLRFFCHGNVEMLEFGKEWITMNTVHLFHSLKGAFRTDAVIALYACLTAGALGPSSGPGSYTLKSTLPSFLKQIAGITGATVIASPDLQFYDRDTMNEGRWDGTVYMVTTAGLVVRAPNLGEWFPGIVDGMRKAGLSEGVIGLAHTEIVKRHPDYVPPPRERIWPHNRF